MTCPCLSCRLTIDEAVDAKARQRPKWASTGQPIALSAVLTSARSLGLVGAA